MAKTGPKRKLGVDRYKHDGSIVRSQRKSEDGPANATALEARMRQILGVDAWKAARSTKEALQAACNDMDDPLLGSALGRLLLMGRRDTGEGITKTQYGAGGYFGWLYRANAKVRGWPSPNAKALDYGAAAPGFSTHDEDSDEYVTDVKRKWSDLYGTVMEADGRQGKVFEALKRVLLEDLDADVGELRMGLNAINRARGVK